MSANSRRVLVIDDERPVADTMSLIFSKNGFDARSAYCAEQAIDIMTVWMPDLILIDVVLPGMNGIDLAIRFRDQVPQRHILLFSGMMATTDLLDDAVQRRHRFEVLAKPIQPEELLEIARQVLKVDKPDTSPTCCNSAVEHRGVDMAITNE